MHSYENGQGWHLSAHIGHLKQDKMDRGCCKVICGATTSAGPKGGQKGHMPPRSDHKAYLAPEKS